MRTSAVATLLVLTLVTGARTGSAQDFDDIAAYAALTFSPPGGLVPLPPPLAGRSSGLVLRYANVDLGLDGSLHNFTVGGDFAAPSGRFGITLGGSTCDGCDGNIVFGMDYTAMLSRNKWLVALRPAFGFAKPTEGDGSALSLAVSLPSGLELKGQEGPIFIPYLAPGFGYGRISGDDETDSGTRPMLGGGLAIAGRQSGLAIHLGFQKTFVDDGETVYGLGLSFGRRSSP